WQGEVNPDGQAHWAPWQLPWAHGLDEIPHSLQRKKCHHAPTALRWHRRTGCARMVGWDGYPDQSSSSHRAPHRGGIRTTIHGSGYFPTWLPSRPRHHHSYRIPNRWFESG